MYATALDDILAQVHFRYVSGFKPQVFDGKVHKLTVQLSDVAKQEYPNSRLSFRPEDIPTNQAQASQ
jgi:hypothetical protein